MDSVAKPARYFSAECKIVFLPRRVKHYFNPSLLRHTRRRRQYDNGTMDGDTRGWDFLTKTVKKVMGAAYYARHFYKSLTIRG